MNPLRRRTAHGFAYAVSLLALVAAVPASAMSSDGQLDHAISYAKTWAEGIDNLQRGQFAKADTVLRKLAGQSPAPEKAGAWMEEWLEAEQARRELTRADYENYVRRAKKWFAKENLNRALKWTYYAMLNTSDDEAFRHLDWVQNGKQAALAEAQKLRRAQEWRDAHALYYSLSLIFENDKEVDKRRKECLEHARLEEIYRPDRDWAEALEGIVPNMVEEALYRIDRKYVVEPDFRKLTVAGLEELLLIAESPTLQEQFEGLTGEEGGEFTRRVQQSLQRVKRQESLTYREALQHFRRALKINLQTAQIPEAIIVREYTNAALDQLDEFSSMIWPHEYREFEKHTRGDFIGVGIQIRNKYNPDLKDTEILVVSPLEDTPAYRAGIQAEDIITKVNGKPLSGVPVTKAVNIITGPKGTTVTLTIRREQENGETVEIDFPLKRDVIEIQSVKSHRRRTDDEQRWDHMLDPEMGVAYVRINPSFQENTVRKLRAALSEAEAEGMRGLILDLRYNPGGLLKSAVQMAELFLARNDRVVSTKGLHSKEFPLDAERDGHYKDLPLIVLINESSASASEIVSGAIKDHGRGLVIGERSFGKFSVQNLIRLMYSDAHLKLTTARYYLPGGKSLHREKGATEWGVEPDIVVPLVPKEHSKIHFMRRDADVIGAVKTSSEDELDEPVGPVDDEDEGDGAGDQEAEEEEEPDPNNRPRRDPQLETALLVMRMHLLHDEALQVAGNTAATINKEVTNK